MRTFLLLLLATSHTVLAADEDCANCPLTLAAAYTGEAWRNADGIRSGGRYLDNLNLALTAQRPLGIQGLTAHADVLYNNGQGLNEELIGTAQGVSNIEADRAVRLYELWGEWRMGGTQSLRAGLYDLNSEFDSIEAAGLFIQPSHGIGPDFSQSGHNGPSIFPNTALAVRAKGMLGGWSLQTAVLDAVPGDPEHPRRTQVRVSKREGALLVGEIGREVFGMRVAAGYWRYTASFAEIGSERLRDDNDGAYLILASPHLLADSDERGLDLYVRLGQAESRLNPIGAYWGAGAVYTGLFTADDQLGFSTAIAELGAPFRRDQQSAGVATTQREAQFELTYRLNLTDWLAVQPDIQYIRHPGMDPQRVASWLFGLRFDVSGMWQR